MEEKLQLTTVGNYEDFIVHYYIYLASIENLKNQIESVSRVELIRQEIAALTIVLDKAFKYMSDGTLDENKIFRRWLQWNFIPLKAEIKNLQKRCLEITDKEVENKDQANYFQDAIKKLTLRSSDLKNRFKPSNIFEVQFIELKHVMETLLLLDPLSKGSSKLLPVAKAHFESTLNKIIEGKYYDWFSGHQSIIKEYYEFIYNSLRKTNCHEAEKMKITCELFSKAYRLDCVLRHNESRDLIAAVNKQHSIALSAFGNWLDMKIIANTQKESSINNDYFPIKFAKRAFRWMRENPGLVISLSLTAALTAAYYLARNKQSEAIQNESQKLHALQSAQEAVSNSFTNAEETIYAETAKMLNTVSNDLATVNATVSSINTQVENIPSQSSTVFNHMVNGAWEGGTTGVVAGVATDVVSGGATMGASTVIGASVGTFGGAVKGIFTGELTDKLNVATAQVGVMRGGYQTLEGVVKKISATATQVGTEFIKASTTLIQQNENSLEVLNNAHAEFHQAAMQVGSADQMVRTISTGLATSVPVVFAQVLSKNQPQNTENRLSIIEGSEKDDDGHRVRDRLFIQFKKEVFTQNTSSTALLTLPPGINMLMLKAEKEKVSTELAVLKSELNAFEEEKNKQIQSMDEFNRHEVEVMKRYAQITQPSETILLLDMGKPIVPVINRSLNFVEKLKYYIQNEDFSFTLQRLSATELNIKFTVLNNVTMGLEEVRNHLVLLIKLLKNELEEQNLSSKCKSDWKEYSLSITGKTQEVIDKISDLLKSAGAGMWVDSRAIDRLLFFSSSPNMLPSSSKDTNEMLPVCRIQ